MTTTEVGFVDELEEDRGVAEGEYDSWLLLLLLFVSICLITFLTLIFSCCSSAVNELTEFWLDWLLWMFRDLGINIWASSFLLYWEELSWLCCWTDEDVEVEDVEDKTFAS